MSVNAFGVIAFFIALAVIGVLIHHNGFLRGWDAADRFWRARISEAEIEFKQSSKYNVKTDSETDSKSPRDLRS